MAAITLLFAFFLVFNEDDSHMVGRVYTRDEYRAYIDEVCRGPVTHFFMCPNSMRCNIPSEVFEPVWLAAKDPETGYRAGSKGDSLKAMHDGGVDPYAVWIERCREKGVSPWITMRMNDIHEVTNPKYGGLSRFWREHPQYWVVPNAKGPSWGDYAFNYAHKEVRDYHLAFVKTCLERYDVDGFECDWMRFPGSFPKNQGAENAKYLTEFMREVRKLAEAATKRRGHPVKVGARVATDPEGSLFYGFDVRAWAKEGLIDWLVPCNFLVVPDYRLPYKEWKKIVGDKITVVPGCDTFIVKEGGRGWQQYLRPAEYRALADYLQAEGAPGMYLFNLFVGPKTTGVWEAGLNGSLLPENVTRGARAYPTWYRENSAPGGRLFQVPVKLDESRTVEFQLGTEPKRDSAINVAVAFDRECFADSAKLPPITLNGAKPLKCSVIKPTAFLPEQTQSKAALRLKFPKGVCRKGVNRLQVGRAPDAETFLRAAELFISPSQKDAPMSVVGLGSFEWKCPAGEGPTHVLAHQASLELRRGFKATVRFSADLAQIKRDGGGYGSIFCKGRGYTDGIALMITDSGKLFVHVKGIEPSYYYHPRTLEANREYTVELYVDDRSVRIFIDGEETGSYSFAGQRDTANGFPLKIGTVGDYKFTGTIPYVKFEPLDAVTVPPGGPLPIVYELPMEQARAKIHWSRPIWKPENRYIGWPTVCRLRSGRIIAVFSGDRDAHVCPWGKVQLVISDDDGETWSEAKTIANGPFDDRDAGIVQLPSGEIVVTYFHSVAFLEGGLLEKNWPKTSPKYFWKQHALKLQPLLQEVPRYAYCRLSSTDNGETWSEPEIMRKVSHAPHGPSLLKDGSLLQLGRSADGKGRSVISAWRSTDAARTWECLCPQLTSAVKGEDQQRMIYHEPNALELPDGTLLGMVRYHGSDNCLRQTVSTDGGRTWSPMAKTSMYGLPPHLLQLADGRLVCVYGRRIAEGGGFGEFATISDDRGRTWDTPHEIMLRPAFNGDLGYPSSCLLPNGDILTVYYHIENFGEKPCLMATKWRVK